jgi:hypothetical protein
LQLIKQAFRFIPDALISGVVLDHGGFVKVGFDSSSCNQGLL